MDTNLGMSSNTQVNDIENDNIDNTDDINIFVCIECNILDNYLGMISMRKIRTNVNRICDQFFLNKELGFQCQLILQ